MVIFRGKVASNFKSINVTFPIYYECYLKDGIKIAESKKSITMSFGATSCFLFSIGLLTITSPVGDIQCSSVKDVGAIDLKYADIAVSKAKPGDTIFIKNGNYQDLEITISNNPDGLVYIMPESPGGVSIVGKSTIIMEKSSNISLQGFLFDQVKNPSAVILNSSSDIEIYNNYFYKCGISRFGFIVRLDRGSSSNKIHQNTFDSSHAMSVVIALRTTNLHTKNNKNNDIFNNLFCNIPSVKSVYPDSDGNGLEAVQLGQGVPGTEQWELETRVYNNLFENIIGDGGEIISNKSSKNYIINNTFRNNKSGITLRAGNDVIVEGNYLNNTEKGIRVFGSGHIIKNNYITEVEVGINLPASDYKRDEAFTASGYHQQENCEIIDNVIISPRTKGISLGEGERKLLPRDIRLSNNRSVIASRSSREYVISPRISRKDLHFSSNEVVILEDSPSDGADARLRSRSTSNNFDSSQVRYVSDRRNSVKRNRDLEAEVERVTRMKPFASLDEKVGATWKRPEKTR